MIAGRVWSFGDNMDTELMLPGPFLQAGEAEQARAVFSANRPGWTELVQPGDILVAGRNFGMGSSRAAARSLRNLRLACAIAESINGLFLRNAVAFGFLALECPGIRGLVAEGQVAEVSLEAWSVRNRDSGASLPILPLPPGLLELMRGKGIYAMLAEQGYIGGLLGARDRGGGAARSA